MAHFSVDPVLWVILTLPAESHCDREQLLHTDRHTPERRTWGHQNTHRVTNSHNVSGLGWGISWDVGFSGQKKLESLKQTGVSWSLPASPSLAPLGKSPLSCVSIQSCFHFHFYSRHPLRWPQWPPPPGFTFLLMTCNLKWTGPIHSLLMRIGQKWKDVSAEIILEKWLWLPSWVLSKFPLPFSFLLLPLLLLLRITSCHISISTIKDCPISIKELTSLPPPRCPWPETCQQPPEWTSTQVLPLSIPELIAAPLDTFTVASWEALS